MLWLYPIGIRFYQLLIKIASYFNHKARLFVEGRKDLFMQLQLQLDPKDRPVWFHFASLGEFEQGRPVLEKLKEIHPSQKIVVTFFSPSGYEIRKNYALASVFYLPIDTRSNARRFIQMVNPRAAIFTKYEFWYHYFTTLAQQDIPLYLISGIFRPNQVFFKWYGGFYRSMLSCVDHFFVQNDESIQLLKQIGINSASLAGDTRFDRVYENAQHPKTLPVIAQFCNQVSVLIAGSTWPEDEQLLVNFVEKHPTWKVIIAPHEIGKDHIAQLESMFPAAIKFSSLEGANVPLDAKVLMIDNIGMLSSLYQYGTMAYIGGGFGAGIHNTLEAAAFGLPVIFGPKYHKFQEAKDLIAIGAAKSITTSKEFLDAFDKLRHNAQAAAAAKTYVTQQKGATELIISHLTENVSFAQ